MFDGFYYGALFTGKLLLNSTVILLLPRCQIGVAAALKALGRHDLVIMIPHPPTFVVPCVNMVLKRDDDVLAGGSLRSADTPVLPKRCGAYNRRLVDSLCPI